MHKKIFYLFLLLCAPTFSQENLSYGFNLGVTYSNFRGNDYFENYKYSIDFLIGLSADYEIKDRLFITADLNYARKSANYFYDESFTVGEGGTIVIVGTPIGENPDQRSKLKFRTRFEFISVPVMLKYFIDSNNKFFLNGGPYLSYLLNNKNINNGEESDLDFNNEFKKIDFGLVFGLGYNFKMANNNNLLLELRNNLGVTSINKYDNSMFNKTKTNSLEFIISWNFNN